MIIIILISFFLALPLAAGIYYIVRGVVHKHRNTIVTGLFLVIAWALVMYFTYTKIMFLFEPGNA